MHSCGALGTMILILRQVAAPVPKALSLGHSERNRSPTSASLWRSPHVTCDDQFHSNALVKFQEIPVAVIRGSEGSLRPVGNPGTD